MKIKQITNPDNNMWRICNPPQRAERVAARIGGGGLKVIDQEHGLSDKSGSVFKQSLEQINERLLENNDIECIANGLSSNDKLTIDMNEVPERLQAELITDYDEFRQMIADAQSIHHNEPDVYFYHSDHLGSASWITDGSGQPVQHLQYLPFGEPFVNQRLAGSTYNERFTFTGKERDEETGYSYFGARYYDSDLSGLFLSVDPMADKYPSISPYAYCVWNPVKLVDPDGEEIDDYFSFDGKYLGSDNAETNNVRIISEATWNMISKDEEGKIDHDVGRFSSMSFSCASRKGMSINAQLAVYQKYNPTDCKLENLDNKGLSWGMRTHFEKGKEPVILIRLEGNSKESIAVCDYADEIINLFAHENGHITQCADVGFEDYSRLSENEQEQNAIKEQMNHQSWNKTRPEYRRAFIEYGKKFDININK